MTVPPLGIGDFAPNALLPDQTGRQTGLYNVPLAGHPLLLFLARDPTQAAAEAALKRFAAAAAGCAERGIRAAAVTGLPPPANRRVAERAGLAAPVLSDAGGGVLGAIGLGRSPGANAVAVWDANARLAAVFHGDFPGDVAALAAARAVALAVAMPAGAAPAHAPVLLVPGVLSADDCAALIAFWETGEKAADMVSSGTAAGIDTIHDWRSGAKAATKKRADVAIPEGDNPVNRMLRTAFERRIVPEIAKCFQYACRSYETARIGCYDAGTEGYFRPHRDAIGERTQERRFALTLNLNDGYEGGDLMFLEYGRQLYRPAPGDAVVFSCRLLHEVVPIRAGRRFVLLTFFM